MEETDLFELIHSVESVTNEMIIRWTKAFGHNIGISPVLVLSELLENGPQQHSALAAKLGYTAAAITNIAGKLVNEGLAERKANEQDRRHVLLAITPEGERVLEAAHRTGTELRVRLFSSLTKEEIEQYITINQKLLEALASSER
ncbi:MarR family winged helix-turn-helix transcriptional regulator [Bhargavaea cecembensis]|uniref:MarR family winged helix-turn-helix transcriptional regulator n=1 Tax=Bhargavaea cecembensis TaxID=394098 RepID=UPI00058BF18E|nr:MarR family transcriptional regulator [Bhargavaea cecembensis]